MRGFTPYLLALVLLPSAGAHGGVGGSDHPPVGNHSPGVASFEWFPFEPQRGELLTAYAEPNASAQVQRIVLRVCRVETYSCRTPIEMTPNAERSTWGAQITWDAAFYRGATTIGLSLLLTFTNGTQESSPVDDWPLRPATMPAEGGHYYYHGLPADTSGTPGLSFLPIVVLLAAVAWGRRR